MEDSKYQDFEQSLHKAVEFFKTLDKRQPVRLISHLDSDGICAASILIKLLNHENMRYSISIVTQLQREIIDELKLEEYKNYIFTDLGQGVLKFLGQP